MSKYLYKYTMKFWAQLTNYIVTILSGFIEKAMTQNFLF